MSKNIINNMFKYYLLNLVIFPKKIEANDIERLVDLFFAKGKRMKSESSINPITTRLIIRNAFLEKSASKFRDFENEISSEGILKRTRVKIALRLYKSICKGYLEVRLKEIF